MFHQHIGILGGGQLGSMLLQAAINYGLQVSIMDSNSASPAARHTNNFVLGNLQSFDAVLSFGKQCDIVTVEIEAVNVEALKALQRLGVKVFPAPETLEIVQDKYRQKKVLEFYNLPVVPGVYLNSGSELTEKAVSLPVMLKRCRDGYDGRGVMPILSEVDIEHAFDVPCVAESLVAITQELSVIVARSESGEVVCYDPVSMVFDKKLNLLAYQICPADVGHDVANAAQELARRVAEALSLVGILAVEMFLTQEGKLLVNEVAPRPHNSGHHTIEACATSQYCQLLRAIMNLPLGSAKTLQKSAMVNLIGADDETIFDMDSLPEFLRMPDVFVHWYGKQVRTGRKLGHLTVIGDTDDQILASLEACTSILKAKR